MAKISKKTKWILAAVVVLGAAFFGFKWWKGQQYAVPDGIASGNGRLEAKLVDATAKEPLRVKEILVDEGDLVKPGQVVVRLDTSTLDAQLAQAKASQAAALEQLAVAQGAIARRKAEINLAKIEVDRSGALVKENAGSQRELDVRRMTLETTQAALSEEDARLQAAKQDADAAKANVDQIQTRINDATLTSPVLGRVLYRLAEPGEVLGPGGKALTIVNLQDVYMEIYLPAEQAARTKIGSEARITVDYEPDRSAAGVVSFVSPEAQFTPKEVETKSEREKLMFRVKIQLPTALVTHYIDRIKTGVRGVGYVKYADSAAWPSWLEKNVMRADATASAQDGGGK
jgi:HlyD family secretion protein